MNNDLISREALKMEVALMFGDKTHITECICDLIDNAETVENITIFCENADEKTVEELKAEMQKAKLAVFEERPQGEWTDISTDGRHTGWIACSVCGQEPPNESNLRTNFCPNCGAKMQNNER